MPMQSNPFRRIVKELLGTGVCAGLFTLLYLYLLRQEAHPPFGPLRWLYSCVAMIGLALGLHINEIGGWIFICTAYLIIFVFCVAVRFLLGKLTALVAQRSKA